MESKDALIAELRELVAEQAAQLKQQAARIADLELELAKAKKDSSTSSKPPSSDIVKPPKKTSSSKKSSGNRKKRKRGGQTGHQRQLRELLPPNRIDETIDYEIKDEEVLRLGLKPTGDFDVVQHIELPEAPVYVTEHRLTVYRAPDGSLYTPDVPELKGPVSRGYLAKLCTKTISDSLKDACQELQDAIPRQEQLGSDETSLKDNGKNHWIWCITAATFTVFHIAKTRSREVLEKLVGTEFSGYLNFDYFSANCSFAWNYWIKAQYCWAHLIRDMRFLLKHPDEKTKAWAEQLLDRSRRLFRAWHRRDEMTDEGFRRSMITHRDRFLELVRKPPSTKEAKNLAARFAVVEYTTDDSEEIQTYDLSQDYFRFMFAEGVEPTNNHNEQQIRHCVIDRRITQGTRGELGQRYHERMWTAIATCKKQNRCFFQFLQQSIAANLQNKTPPSLLNV